MKDGSTKYPLPTPTQFDPLTIAALRGGWPSVFMTALFTLWNHGHIDFTGSGKKTVITTISELKSSNVIKQEIYRWLPTPRRDLAHNVLLRSRIEEHLKSIYNELENTHLMRNKDEFVRIWMIFGPLSFALASIGGTKLLLEVSQKGILTFLIFLVLYISLIFLLLLLEPWKTRAPTRLGDNYLKTLKIHYDWLKEETKTLETASKNDNFDFCVAIFGLASLTGTIRRELWYFLPPYSN